MPLSISDMDLSGRFEAPFTTRLRFELSNKESMASCSIRFSLRIIISGAFNCISRLRRLLRFITRRYKSFKSDVAKRPPSSCTIGRNSGGITGMASKIIHEHLLPEARKFSTISMRFNNRLSLFAPFSIIFARNSAASSSRFKFSKSVFIASAPIPAEKEPP